MWIERLKKNSTPSLKKRTDLKKKKEMKYKDTC